MASKKNLSLAEQVAATLIPAKSAPVTLVEEKFTLSASDLQKAIEVGVLATIAKMGLVPASAPVAPAAKPEAVSAPRPVGRPKKTPTPAPAPAKPEPVTGDAALLLKAKAEQCFKAAKAACKAAGVGSDRDRVTGQWIDRPNGGRFTEGGKPYWTAFWAGYNAEADRLGIPRNTK